MHTHTYTNTRTHTHTLKHRVLTREQRQHGADFLYETSFLVLISLRACSAKQKPVARLSVLLLLHQTLAQAPVRLASTRHRSIHFYFSTAGKYTSPINTLLLQYGWQVHVTNQYTSTSVQLASTHHQSIHFYFSTAGKYTSPISTLLLQYVWQVHITNQYTSTSVGLASTRHKSIHFYFSRAGKYTSPISTLLLQ